MAAKIFVSSLTHNRVSSFPRSNGSIEGSCTHCGNPKHTTYNCFKKNVYPYWWDSFTERKSHEGLDRRNKKEVDKKDGGKVASMVSLSHSPSALSLMLRIALRYHHHHQLMLCLFSILTYYNHQYVSTSPLPRKSVGEELNWTTILLDSTVEYVLPSIEHVEVDEPSDIGAESLEPIIGVSVTVEPDISVSPSTPVVPSCSDRYQLPPRITRGHPPNKYSPNNSKTVKYPIAYYVSTDHLPTAIKAFVN
ncbi:hypothetical protein LWI28_016863 [Acer negundo]|uniref:Uncharacterized protein n=1 Tax=Acer negundo TaxID=4023 RepID=A0AAD5NEX8_ACENE|nr:hypothetical protein LWI28_016863 [Acer negundo]